jgi:hypothetical protein
MADEKALLADEDLIDDLERSFQGIIAEIVADQSLAQFREEYEKVHDALSKSHANNTELVQRCRELNSAILANSAKVNSILQLSQDDQRTIAGLRFEFEKAWKMVEISEHNDSKAREMIDQLKIEVSDLSKSVNSGSIAAFTDTTTLETIDNDIKCLRHELVQQGDQIEVLTRDIAIAEAANARTRSEIAVLAGEQDGILADLDQQHADRQAVQSDILRVQQTSSSVRDDCCAKQDAIAEYQSAQQQSLARLHKLGEVLSGLQSTILDDSEDLKEQNGRVEFANSVLHRKLKVQTRLATEMESFKKRITDPSGFVTFDMN